MPTQEGGGSAPRSKVRVDGRVGGRQHRSECALTFSKEHAQNRVEHLVEFLSNILGKKSQHEIAVFLQQAILASITAICFHVREVLRTVQFYSDMQGCLVVL